MAEFKPKTPYGVLPVLEVDGEMLAGNCPIALYLAEEYGLAGSNAFENAEIAGIIDVVNESLWQKDEARKTELRKEFEEKHMPRYLGALEKRVTENDSADGWLYAR